MLIKQEDCCLLVIDVQARLLPATYNPMEVADRCRDLIQACREVKIPILVSEHYPKGIGHTADRLAELIEPSEVMEKIYFSCFSERSVRHRIRETGKGTLIVAGMEAHVCLGQTVLDLLGAGFRVAVPSDATASRRPLDHAAALRRLRAEGAVVMATATILDRLRDTSPVTSRFKLERIQ